ncbi:unnamed protein product [Brachionus calyciflorus]|uniref:Uncharacterized protein n=1 Tax=Brachionus calyciflorus TaxID=104777 RepID=A0A813UF18_9BILA|nr:unnamed protein product [Brachionus calyciflorus]
MDQVKITLPCGFETTYRALNFGGEKVKKCIMCEQEDLIVDSVLNLPANRLRLKEKEIELELEKLKKLQNEISSVKQDPHFYFEKSYERILIELDIRKEVVKRKFEKKLDDYYTNLTKDLKAQKDTIIKNFEENLAKEAKSARTAFERPSIDSLTNIEEKFSVLETYLKEISQKSDDLNKLIRLSKKGQNKKLHCCRDNIDIERIFGDIVTSDPQLNYKPAVVFDNRQNDSSFIFCREEVAENKFLFGFDKKIQLWDVSEKKRLMEYTGHSDHVLALCMIQNDMFASCSADCTIKIWNISSSKCVRTILGHPLAIVTLICLKNGKLVSSSFDKTIKLWNYKTGECIKKLESLKQISNFTLEGENNTIICASEDYSIRIWNVETGINVKTLKGHTEVVHFLKLINSNSLASGSFDKKVKYWSLESGQCLKTFEVISEYPGPLAILNSGYLISGSVDGTIRFWDTDSGECLKMMQANRDNVCGLYLTKNENVLTICAQSSPIFWSKF